MDEHCLLQMLYVCREQKISGRVYDYNGAFFTTPWDHTKIDQNPSTRLRGPDFMTGPDVSTLLIG